MLENMPHPSSGSKNKPSRKRAESKIMLWENVKCIQRCDQKSSEYRPFRRHRHMDDIVILKYISREIGCTDWIQLAQYRVQRRACKLSTEPSGYMKRGHNLTNKVTTMVSRNILAVGIGKDIHYSRLFRIHCVRLYSKRSCEKSVKVKASQYGFLPVTNPVIGYCKYFLIHFTIT
jgi:hypothetical protein